MSHRDLDYKWEGKEVRGGGFLQRKQRSDNTANVHICKKQRDGVLSIQLFVFTQYIQLVTPSGNEQDPRFTKLSHLYMKPHICTTSKALVLTSETPTPCCPEGTPVWFSASERYSGNGKHAEEEENNRVEVRSQVRGDCNSLTHQLFASTNQSS